MWGECECDGGLVGYTGGIDRGRRLGASGELECPSPHMVTGREVGTKEQGAGRVGPGAGRGGPLWGGGNVGTKAWEGGGAISDKLRGHVTRLRLD